MTRFQIELSVYFGAVALFCFLVYGHYQAPVAVPLELEVANTPAEQAKGLGGRDSMPQGHGMLFTWSKPEPRCMWAKDMQFDLQVAFLDTEGKVFQIEEMKAGTTNPHCSREPAQYVLEVNKGYFNKKE